MIWARRGGRRVRVGGAEGDLDALQAPQVLLVACLCTVEEVRQWDVEVCGETWPVCPAIVGGARAGNDLPEDFLLVLVPLDLGGGQQPRATVRCTLTLGGSRRGSSGLLDGTRTTTLTFNGAMRAIPNAGRGWEGDIAGYGRLSLLIVN